MCHFEKSRQNPALRPDAGTKGREGRDARESAVMSKIPAGFPVTMNFPNNCSVVL